MKTPLLLLLAGGSLAAWAAETPRPESAPAFAWVDPADPAAATIRQTGEQLISRVGNMLIFEVEHSIASQGLLKAIEVVHLKDLSLPKPEAGQPRVTAIRRTSLSLRNPANQPDAADKAALDKIDEALRDGDEVPKLLLQRVTAAGVPEEWRVYRPITAMPQCIKCHGARESLPPEIRDFLDQHYPADKAVDYTPYQWRGVIRISLVAAAPAIPAKTK